MELVLYRVYKNGTKKFMFSEEAGNVDSFTMGFYTEEKMIDYFSEMQKVYNPDGTIDNGSFVVFERTIENGEVVMTPQPIFYTSDFNRYLLDLNNKLHQDKELLSHLLNTYPDIFNSSIRERLEACTSMNIPFSVYKLNVDSFSNSLFSSSDFKKNFRGVLHTVADYYLNQEERSAGTRRARIIKFPNGN